MVDATRFQKKLRSIPDKVMKSIRIEMEKRAEKIVAEMKVFVPVRRGALRDSIGWTWGDAPKGSMALGVMRAANDKGLYITFYAGTRDKNLGDQDAFYARWVEFGTRNMPASPFFFIVWRLHKRRVRNGINRTAKKALKSL